MKLSAAALSLLVLVAVAWSHRGPAERPSWTNDLAAADAAAAQPSSTVGTAESPASPQPDVTVTPTPDADPGVVAQPLQPGPWALAPAPAAAMAPPTDALAALVLDEASGTVLYEHNAHQTLAPASLTKIATAVVALQQGDLDAWVDVDVDSEAMPRSSVMGLLPGDRFQLRDLLYGLMLPSGNDAALVIGRAVSGSDAAFVADMNALAADLGLTNTHFSNAHGLSARDHFTSAYDLAILSRYAMTVPGFADIASTRYWTAKGNREIPLGNQNGLLGAYAGADGIKVGYTHRAGKTRVASAVRDGHRVYVVLLNATDTLEDSKALLDWAFANHTWP